MSRAGAKLSTTSMGREAGDKDEEDQESGKSGLKNHKREKQEGRGLSSERTVAKEPKEGEETKGSAPGSEKTIRPTLRNRRRTPSLKRVSGFQMVSPGPPNFPDRKLSLFSTKINGSIVESGTDQGASRRTIEAKIQSQNLVRADTPERFGGASKQLKITDFLDLNPKTVSKAVKSLEFGNLHPKFSVKKFNPEMYGINVDHWRDGSPAPNPGCFQGLINPPRNQPLAAPAVRISTLFAPREIPNFVNIISSNPNSQPSSINSSLTDSYFDKVVNQTSVEKENQGVARVSARRFTFRTPDDSIKAVPQSTPDFKRQPIPLEFSFGVTMDPFKKKSEELEGFEQFLKRPALQASEALAAESPISNLQQEMDAYFGKRESEIKNSRLMNYLDQINVPFELFKSIYSNDGSKEDVSEEGGDPSSHVSPAPAVSSIDSFDHLVVTNLKSEAGVIESVSEVIQQTSNNPTEIALPPMREERLQGDEVFEFMDSDKNIQVVIIDLKDSVFSPVPPTCILRTPVEAGDSLTLFFPKPITDSALSYGSFQAI